MRSKTATSPRRRARATCRRPRPRTWTRSCLSHLHFDHAGGATREDSGRPACRVFPNATLYVQALGARPRARAATSATAPPTGRRTGSRTRRRAGSRRSRARREIRPGLTRARRCPATTPACRRSASTRGGRTAFYFADAAADLGARADRLDHGLRPLPGGAHPEQEAPARPRRRRGVACDLRARPRRAVGTIVDEVNGKRRVHVMRENAMRTETSRENATRTKNVARLI